MILLGPLATRADLRHCRRGEPLIAVDAGTRVALELGLRPVLAVGDWDGLGGTKLLRAEGIPHLTLPREKDRSDLHYALRAARVAGAESVLALGLTGGRPDHHLAGLFEFAEAAPWFHALEARDSEARYVFVTPERPWKQRARTRGLFSVFAMAPRGARGVTIQGAKFGLRAATVEVSSHGLSNVFKKGKCSISVKSGTLLVILPDSKSKASGRRK